MHAIAGDFEYAHTLVMWEIINAYSQKMLHFNTRREPLIPYHKLSCRKPIHQLLQHAQFKLLKQERTSTVSPLQANSIFENVIAS